ncbi:MAG: hypothetical protein HY075_02715 [Deltaproteobacteria bacterium]|nr:hypothetical protein [Deltaproteobacteria bacterium]
MIGTEFIFITCQAGAESVLKHEVSREWPTFKLAYSRPGFITFKVAPDADVGPGFDLRCVFARAYGISLGKAEGSTTAERAMFAAMLARQRLPGQLRLNVWEREKTDPSFQQPEEPSGEPSPLVREAESAIRAAQDGLFLPEGEAGNGDVVFSVVLVEPDEWWIGYHLHSRYHRPWSGGLAKFTLPAAAPSRAYLKLREGINWPGLPVKKGEVALELGSAPGGASLALLEQGLSVIGVDPADMDKSVVAHEGFRHVRLQAKQLKPEDTGAVDWLFSDMNVDPYDAVDAVEKVMKGLGTVAPQRLLGALLTLKLTSWTKPLEVPELVRKLMERLLTVGFVRVQAGQLFYNRREVCVACFTPAGELRLNPPAAPAEKKQTRTGRR